MRVCEARRLGMGVLILLVASVLVPGVSTIEGPSVQAQGATLGLQQVVSGLNEPLYVTHAGDGSGRLFVVEKAGRVKVIVNGQVQATPFLDIDALVNSDG